MGGRGKIIQAHGGYRDLKAYQLAEIIYDGTTAFCRLYIAKPSRTIDQMVQAARSGKKNIAEGSEASGTSQKTELKLMGVARGSLEELLLDYEDFLRQRNLDAWPRDHEKSEFIRKFATRPGRNYETYKSYVESKGPENAANVMLCVVHQANYPSIGSLSVSSRSSWTVAGSRRTSIESG
jgi:restriction system protein